MPKVHDVEQGSDEWFALRRGCITATRAQALFGRGMSRAGGAYKFTSYLSKRDESIAEIAMERLNHSGKPNATGAALRRGHDFEDDARMSYSFHTGHTVTECGFMTHDADPILGCSPDGLIGDDGMVQIKVPTSVKKHVDYLQTGFHAAEYGWQLMHELYVAGRKWTDIVSYCPEAEGRLQLAIQRVLAPKTWCRYHALLAAADAAIEDEVAALKSIQINTIQKAA